LLEVSRMVELHPGLTAEKSLVVTPAVTARHLGSGEAAVFATPAMVALIEGAAVALVAPALPAGQQSVGTMIQVRHLAATPIGARVTAKVTLTAIEGRRLTFAVEAYDEWEKIGEGTHERFIIDIDRFTERVARKQKPLNKSLLFP